MLRYIRRNLVAFVALAVAIILSGGTVAYAANTVRSSDIVDGQVERQDIAANAIGNGKIQDGSVLGADIKDHSLTSDDIKLSTLGQVPNAKTLDGVGLPELRRFTVALHDETDSCVTVGIWSQCAVYGVRVPAGHQYVLTVTSSVTVNPGNTAQVIAFCPAVTGPTCIAGGPDDLTLPANQYTNASTSATQVLNPGVYTISTALHVLSPIARDDFANTSTLVDFYDVKGIAPNE